MLRLCLGVLGSAALTAAKAPIRSGSGDWVFEYQPDLLQVPPSPASGGQNVLNGHGIARDAAGNLYFTFQPANVAEDTQVLVRWNADGTNGTLLGEKGPSGLSQGVPHGLRLEHDEADGKDYLYHANNEALVFKTTTDGEVIYKIDLSDWQKSKPHFWPCRPTDATVVGDTLYVSDGKYSCPRRRRLAASVLRQAARCGVRVWCRLRHVVDPHVRQKGRDIQILFWRDRQDDSRPDQIPHSAQPFRGPAVPRPAPRDRPFK